MCENVHKTKKQISIEYILFHLYIYLYIFNRHNEKNRQIALKTKHEKGDFKNIKIILALILRDKKNNSPLKLVRRDINAINADNVMHTRVHLSKALNALRRRAQ